MSVSWALLPFLTDHIFELPEALEFTYKVKRWQADPRGCCPVLQSRINVDWLTFDPQMFAPLFPRLKEGILHDVFIQKAVVAWDNAPSNRIMVSLLLPGPMEADQWLHDVRASRNMWPLQMTSHDMTIRWPRTSLCGESAGDYRRVIFGRRSNPTGP